MTENELQKNSNNELQKNELTQEVMSYLWKQIDKIHPSAFDGWCGMGIEEWTEFGVNTDDTPEEAYQKVSKGIEMKLETKAYGWFMCDCGAIDCSYIYPKLTAIPEEILKDYPQGKDKFGFAAGEKWTCTAHPDPRIEVTN